MRLPLTRPASAALLLTGLAGSAAAQQDTIPGYEAVYDVSFRSFSGTAQFSVAPVDDSTFVFESSTRIRGLIARALVGNNPAVEHSRFRVSADRIEPEYFRFEDGTRKGEDNFEIAFDSGDEIRVTGPETALTLPHEPDLLDRGSLQIRLMRDVAACRLPGPYRYVDDDGITSYEYERLEDRDTETGIGTLATVRFAQQRPGSGRRTVLWLAPDYGSVPVRIERFDDGELEWSFALESLDGIEREPRSCSGFR